MMNKYWIAPLLAALVFAGACETTKKEQDAQDYKEAEVSVDRFISANYKAVDMLLGLTVSGAAPTAVNNFDHLGSGNGGPVLVATLVDVTFLERSSPLGRLISEQLVSRIAQLGRPVVEMKLRGSVFVKNNNGEFLLTREVRELASNQNASAVLVGTYAESGNAVFVSLKLVNPSNSIVLSSYDYGFPLDRTVRRLLSSTTSRR
jgi:TolB-like protein